MNKIEINNLSKSYKDVLALKDVNLTFEKGKIYGLLGRNGAGKTTMINIIANRIFADTGTVTIDGLNAYENDLVREKVFFMSEADLYDKDQKIKNLYKWTNEFYDCFDIEKAYGYAKIFGLDINKKFKGLSKGFKSIFKLSIALSLDVDYVVYDEPVLGLDAYHRELFYKLMMEDYENTGKTVIIATHLIEEVATIIEEVIIINEGKVILNDQVDNVLSKGYAVSGLKDQVDEYIVDKEVIGFEGIGGLKVAYILGEVSRVKEGSTLQFSKMNLQKIFVKLTDKEVI